MPFKEIEGDGIPSTHPVAVFAEFWRTAAAGAAVAPWDRFDPAEHPRILPWVLLLKTEQGPGLIGDLRLRYAVCGTGLTDLFGMSYEGKLFGEDLPPDAALRRIDEFKRVMAGSGPLFSHTELPIPGKDFHEVYRGVFAFGPDDHTVDRICVILAPASLAI